MTGIFFLVKGKQNNMKNLMVLGIGFIAIPVGFVGRFVFNLTPIFQEYFVFIGFVSLVIFTNLTFYKNRMKKANLILVIVIILGIVQLILFHMFYEIEINRDFEYYLRVSLDLPYNLLVFNWLAYSCYSAYKRLIDQDIEPWIKFRYKLIAIFSFILSFINVPEFFQPENVRWGTPSDPISLIIFGITAIMAIIYAIGFSLSWFMPKWLRNYYNKGYKRELEKEYTEDELMSLIKNQINK
jgi:hypothetical protein